MVKRYTAVFALFAFVIALAVSSLAVTEEIPEIHVPDKSYFKMELDLPSAVDSGDEFTGQLYVKKTYGTFASGGITSVSGKLSYNKSLFKVVSKSYSGNGYTAKISADGFEIRFTSKVSYNKLTEFKFPITVRALYLTDKDNESIDRTYICADYVSAKGDKVYNGIGGIGYTEFVYAVGGTSSQAPSQASSEVSYEESSEESSEVSEDIPVSVGERFDSFISEYRLNEDGKYISGFKPSASEDEITRKYPEITVIHNNYAAEQSGYMATGDVLMFFDGDGNVYKRLVCVLKGDLNGDGRLTSSDYIAMRSHILKIKQLSATGFAAADINEDGKITALDYILLRMHMANRTDIYNREV